MTKKKVLGEAFLHKHCGAGSLKLKISQTKSSGSETKIYFHPAKWQMSILWCQYGSDTPTSVCNFIAGRARVTKQRNQQQGTTNNNPPSAAARLSPDESKSPPDQIPQVYYSRKPSRRDGGGQDVTGSSIDWLRLKIGQSGWIDKLGAWTESWDAQREGGLWLLFLLFFLFGGEFQAMRNWDWTRCTRIKTTKQRQLVSLFG